MVLKLFTTFIVVAAILASPKHRDFTWSYRSSIYRVHCLGVRAVPRALIGGEGCIFIYSGPARLVSFEIKLISKEVSRAEPEYMNIPPPPQLAF